MNIIKVFVENSKFKRTIDFYHFVKKFYWSKSIMYNYGCFADYHQYLKYILLSRCYLGLDSLDKADKTLNQASNYLMEWDYFYYKSKYYHKIDNLPKSANYLDVAKKLKPNLDSILRLEAELEWNPLDY